jgi:hypothetical protein
MNELTLNKTGFWAATRSAVFAVAAIFLKNYLHTKFKIRPGR